jgi:hypothetical protein
MGACVLTPRDVCTQPLSLATRSAVSNSGDIAAHAQYLNDGDNDDKDHGGSSVAMVR